MLEDVAGWAVVFAALGLYACAFLVSVAFLLGMAVTGWGPHDQLQLREALVPLWCLLARDDDAWARLEAILEARQEQAGQAPYKPRHASLEPLRDEDRADLDARIWLASHHWGPRF
jgi:hypothetical protein